MDAIHAIVCDESLAEVAVARDDRHDTEIDERREGGLERRPQRVGDRVELDEDGRVLLVERAQHVEGGDRGDIAGPEDERQSRLGVASTQLARDAGAHLVERDAGSQPHTRLVVLQDGILRHVGEDAQSRAASRSPADLDLGHGGAPRVEQLEGLLHRARRGDERVGARRPLLTRGRRIGVDALDLAGRAHPVGCGGESGGSHAAQEVALAREGQLDPPLRSRAQGIHTG